MSDLDTSSTAAWLFGSRAITGLSHFPRRLALSLALWFHRPVPRHLPRFPFKPSQYLFPSLLSLFLLGFDPLLFHFGQSFVLPRVAVDWSGRRYPLDDQRSVVNMRDGHG